MKFNSEQQIMIDMIMKIMNDQEKKCLSNIVYAFKQVFEQEAKNYFKLNNEFNIEKFAKYALNKKEFTNITLTVPILPHLRNFDFHTNFKDYTATKLISYLCCLCKEIHEGGGFPAELILVVTIYGLKYKLIELGWEPVELRDGLNEVLILLTKMGEELEKTGGGESGTKH